MTGDNRFLDQSAGWHDTKVILLGLAYLAVGAATWRLR